MSRTGAPQVSRRILSMLHGFRRNLYANYSGRKNGLQRPVSRSEYFLSILCKHDISLFPTSADPSSIPHLLPHQIHSAMFFPTAQNRPNSFAYLTIANPLTTLAHPET